MKIALVGYFGHENIGDEAILQSVIQQLKKYHKPLEILVFTNTPTETSELYNVSTLKRKSIINIIAAIRMSDIILFAGGTLFQDETSFGSLIYYLFIIVLAKIFKRKVILYSQGVEPFRYYLSKFLVKQVFLFVDHISVRDRSSQAYLKKTLKIKKNIRFNIDSAMLLCPLQLNNKYRNFIGLNLMDVPNIPIEMIIKDLMEFTKTHNKKILYIPFQERDRILGEKLQKYFGVDSFVILDVMPNISELLGIIQQLDFLVGARLHSLILSATAYTPFIGIHIYDKVKSFSTDVHQNYLAFNDLQKGVLYSTLIKVFNNKNKLKNQLKQTVENLKEQSKDSLINNILIKYEKT